MTTVYCGIKGSKVKANGMLIRLSVFLNFSLGNDPEEKIRLFEELKALIVYLEIEKTRFESRLTVNFQIERETKALLVASLLLQPLVENSIKYTIAQMSNAGIIGVIIKCQNGFFQMEIADHETVKDAAYLNEKAKTQGQTVSSHTGVCVQTSILWAHS